MCYLRFLITNAVAAIAMITMAMPAMAMYSVIEGAASLLGGGAMLGETDAGDEVDGEAEVD